MTEGLKQLVADFEEKLTIIFQQMVTESERLKNEARELHRSYEILRDEKAKLKAENLKLKNGILQASESMRDFLKAIVEEGNKDPENE